MKKLLSAFLLLVCTACASTFTLQWDSSPSAGVAKYKLYASTNLSNWFSFTNTTALTVVVTNLSPAKYWLYATAVSTNGIESDPSNVIAADIPSSPATLRIVIIP